MPLYVHTLVDSIVDRGVSVPRGRAAVCSQGRTQPVNRPVQMTGVNTGSFTGRSTWDAVPLYVPQGYARGSAARADLPCTFTSLFTG